MVPLINLTELAAYKRLFNLEVLPLLIAGVTQQAPSRPEAHHTAAPRAGGRSLAALLCCRHHPQPFPAAVLAPQKSWSLSPGMQRIILIAQLTELHRSLRKARGRVGAAQSLVKKEAVVEGSARLEHVRAGQSPGAWAGCWAGSDGGHKCPSPLPELPLPTPARKL